MTTEVATLGEFLRQEREKRNITLEQVASATKIGVKTLHSLEANHYSDLPAAPFIRGFVISYCRFIGLDSKEVLAAFTDFIGKKTAERPKRDGGHSGYAFEKRDGEQQSRTLLLIAIFGFMGVGAIGILLLKPTFHHHRKSHLEKLQAQQPEQPTASPSPSALPHPTLNTPPFVSPLPPQTATVESPPKKAISIPTPLATPSTTPLPPIEATKPGMDPTDPLDSGHSVPIDQLQHRTIFKVKDDLWVRYQVDERPARKFIIRKGKSLVLRARKTIRFQASNPESVQFSDNSSAFETLSQSKKKIIHRGEATLFLPKELAQETPEPFADTRPLPRITPSNPEPTASPSPSAE